MKATIEISMYPLTNDYIKEVDAFIRSLYKYKVEVKTSYSSTLVIGEYNDLMEAVKAEMFESFKRGKASFVMKVLPGDLSQDVDIDGYH